MKNIERIGLGGLGLVVLVFAANYFGWFNSSPVLESPVQAAEPIEAESEKTEGEATDEQEYPDEIKGIVDLTLTLHYIENNSDSLEKKTYILRSDSRETVLSIPEAYIKYRVPWTKNDFENSKDLEFYQSFTFEDFKGKFRYLVLEMRLPDLRPEKIALGEDKEKEAKGEYDPLVAGHNYILLKLTAGNRNGALIGLNRMKNENHYEFSGDNNNFYGLLSMGRRLNKNQDGEWVIPPRAMHIFYWPAEWDEEGGMYFECLALKEFPNSRCQAKRDYSNRIFVDYMFYKNYLPIWKFIDQGVVSFIDSMVVEERDFGN
ncbi:MAG: hypothetical protein V3R64_02030 [Sphingomonadales bacterium]